MIDSRDGQVLACIFVMTCMPDARILIRACRSPCKYTSFHPGVPAGHFIGAMHSSHAAHACRPYMTAY